MTVSGKSNYSHCSATVCQLCTAGSCVHLHYMWQHYCHTGLYHALVLMFSLSPSRHYFLLFFLLRIFLIVLFMRKGRSSEPSFTSRSHTTRQQQQQQQHVKHRWRGESRTPKRKLFHQLQIDTSENAPVSSL